MIAVATSMEDVLRERLDQSKAKYIAGMLDQYYPGYGWAVNADTRNNIATVNAIRLSGDWGFYLHLDKLDPTGREIVRYGGELLERYKVKRGAIDRDEVRNLERDFTGNFKVDA